MARPRKDGVDYFPLDVDFLNDKKVRLVIAERGHKGALVILYIWGKVYGKKGYFLPWDNDDCVLASADLGESFSPQYISDAVKSCVKYGLFDGDVLAKKAVLTSAGIQRRYLGMVGKSRDEIRVYQDYWLLSENEIQPSVFKKILFFDENNRKTPVSQRETPVSQPENPKSKGKQTKLKQTKLKNTLFSNENKERALTRIIPPTVEEVAAYCAERNNGIDAQRFVDYYTVSGWMMGNNRPIRDWKACVRIWERIDDGRDSCSQEKQQSSAEYEEMVELYMPSYSKKGDGALEHSAKESD